MDTAERKRLEEAGFRIGTVAEFLELTPEQSELVEIKVNLSAAIREQRTAGHLSQAELAEKIGSSQSRVAKMEAGDAGVSLDLIIRALVAQGMTRRELANVIAGQAACPRAAAEPPGRITARSASRPKGARKRVPAPEAAGV